MAFLNRGERRRRAQPIILSVCEYWKTQGYLLVSHCTLYFFQHNDWRTEASANLM